MNKKLSKRDKLRKEILKNNIEIPYVCCSKCSIENNCLLIRTKIRNQERLCETNPEKYTMFKQRPEYHYTVTERWFREKGDIHKRFIVKDNYTDEIILDNKRYSPYGWWIKTVNLFLPKNIISENNAEHVVQKVKKLKDL